MWYISATLLLLGIPFAVLKRKLKVAPDTDLGNGKMKKVCLLIFAAVLMMTGCTKEKTNNLQGFWATPSEYFESGYTYYGNEYYPSYHWRYDVLEIVNNNTIVFYGSVIDSKLAFEAQYSTQGYPLPEHSGWYYNGKKGVGSYILRDNKIITSDGTIFTYLDGKLYGGGCSDGWSKW